MAAVALLIDGAPLTAELAAATLSISVRQVLNAPAMAVIVFADPPAAALAPLRIGAALTVAAPTGENLIEAEITSVEQPDRRRQYPRRPGPRL